jgi:hypothetical protein
MTAKNGACLLFFFCVRQCLGSRDSFQVMLFVNALDVKLRHRYCIVLAVKGDKTEAS